MSGSRKAVLGSVGVLFLIWLVLNFGRITADQDGLIRFVLGTFFSLLIMVRWKPSEIAGRLPSWLVPAAGLGGTLSVVGGIVFNVHQFEWLGLILLLYACLRWALPPRFEPDILLALLLAYWIHPLPGQVFGKFQLAMQKLSVNTAEWLLHGMNARIWADGFFLRTGFRVFGVPESCSGMRTAVTVMLCTLGAVVLLRLKWYAGLIFVALGVLQVLLLNVVRIVGMVLWSPRMPPEWGETFLHDSLGVFLLLAIGLVQAEVSIWRHVRNAKAEREKGIETGRLERRVRTSRLPAVWRRVLKWGWVAVTVLLVAGAAAAVIFKSRPRHRRIMRRAVIAGLMKTDLESAERAIGEQLKADPSDASMLANMARVLVRRRKYGEALDVFALIPGELGAMLKLTKSQALMGTERGAEAAAIVDDLPGQWLKLPGVGILRAEYAARQDDPETAGKSVVLAAKSHIPIERVRSLFPYLAAHRQWQAIVEADDAKPYEDPLNALIAVHASLNVNDIAGAAEALESAVKKWPNDVRFLDALSSVAVNRPGGVWGDRFAESLEANVSELGAERLPSYISRGFRLGRPDIAWLAYVRLRQLDPRTPAAYILPAEFGRQWFIVRRRRLGLKAGDWQEVIDLRPFYLQTRNLAPFKSLWDLVPLAGEIARGDSGEMRHRYLDMAIEELERQKKAGDSPRSLYTMHASALASAGRYPEAHAVLKEMDEAYPGSPADTLFGHAVFYERQRRWQESYEALRQYFAVVEMPGHMAYLMMINSMMRLDLGVAAMETADRARRAFPGAWETEAAVAAIWQVFGFREQALFTMTRVDAPAPLPTIVQLLYETGRFEEAAKMSRVLGVPIRRRTNAPKQRLILRPAEFAVSRRWPEPLSAEQMDSMAVTAAGSLAEATSQFVRHLTQLTAEWHRKHGSAEVSDAAIWRAAGRDELEQGTALHRLAVLLGRQRDYEGATSAVKQAVELLPRSAVLWRILVALTEGELSVIDKARAQCPDDPDLWLAWLVTRVRQGDKGEWLAKEIESAVVRDRFSVGAIVRAGDFLLRRGRIEEAAKAARYAVDKGPGLLASYVLGVGCALAKRDPRWALACAYGGVEHASNPSPFYRTIVKIKQLGGEMDGDMLVALEFLKERFPKEYQWTEDLGQAYFQQGDSKRVLSVLGPLINEGAVGVRFESLVLAAEAARLEGRPDEAVRILEAAYKIHPDKVPVLNNLVYLLSQDAASLPRARQLLPKLLEMGGDLFAVLDTAAMVYLRCGQVELAREYMSKALGKVDDNDYAALEVKLNEAGLLYRTGRYVEAKQKLEAIRIQAGNTPLVDYGAKALLEKVEDKLKEQRESGRRGR